MFNILLFQKQKDIPEEQPMYHLRDYMLGWWIFLTERILLVKYYSESRWPPYFNISTPFLLQLQSHIKAQVKLCNEFTLIWKY